MPKKLTGTNADNTLTGSSGEDAIYGLGGRDLLDGMGGNDLLDGGLGGDRMRGGEGDDQYVIDNVADRVTELSDEGVDTVLASIQVVLMSANVENLTFTNSARHTGVGNSLANLMTGNNGVDRLIGKGGDDTLRGNSGNDYLSGGSGKDMLLGGSGQDMLYGGAGNDFLDGGINSDVMSGGSGSDTFIVDNVNDRVSEVSSPGIDTVQSTVDFKLSTNVENLNLVGIYSADGTGNRSDNRIVGNNQKNILKGMDGNDTLDGGKGSDRLTGGDGADRFVFSSAPSIADNTDIITDFIRADGDKIHLSQEIFADFETGRISGDAFYAAPGAKRATEDGQFLIYDSASGALFYDAEGPDGRGPIQIAQLGIGDHPLLNYGDFVIIA